MSDESSKDWLAICDAQARYAFGIDTRDWALLRSAMADELELDFTSWRGGRSLDLFPSVKRIKADDWIEGVRRSMSGFSATHHLLGLPLRTPGGDADHVRVRTHVQATHFLPNEFGDSTFVAGGYYDNRFVRDGGAWRIDQLKLVVLWSTGNRFVFELAYRAYTP